ncbi:ephrin type-A receptor 4a-like [Sycon ciliatum]|uniref:ephrin type-A receptor 4a-like n=1 Tax=Sycon ciliatum TaxID=27933 RepID=UPI0031F6FAA9
MDNNGRPDIKDVLYVKLLGSGAFGHVWEASWLSGGKHVAVKFPGINAHKNATWKWKTDFIRECKMIQSLHHDNIVHVHRVSSDNAPMPYIIMEMADHGSLLSVVTDLRGNDKLTGGRKRCGMCVGVANGMQYLAEKHIVHRDLAARNVLVMRGEICKITDFGLTRRMMELSESVQPSAKYFSGETGQDYFSTQENPDGPFPLFWSAPETYHAKGTTEGDVWSFGVVLWEVMSFGLTPFLSDSALWRVAANTERMKEFFLSSPDNRLPKPDDCLDEIYDLMQLTWKIQPSERPTFRQLKEKLREVYNTQLIVSPSSHSAVAVQIPPASAVAVQAPPVSAVAAQIPPVSAVAAQTPPVSAVTAQTPPLSAVAVQTPTVSAVTVQTPPTMPGDVQTQRSKAAVAQAARSKVAEAKTERSKTGAVRTARSKAMAGKATRSKTAVAQPARSKVVVAHGAYSKVVVAQTSRSKLVTVKTARSKVVTVQTTRSKNLRVQATLPAASKRRRTK